MDAGEVGRRWERGGSRKRENREPRRKTRRQEDKKTREGK
jgi:hypothetical protein